MHIVGHDIAEFFARNAAPPVTILNECHLQPQQQQQQHPVSTAPHDVVLDLGLSAVVTPKKNDKVCSLYLTLFHEGECENSINRGTNHFSICQKANKLHHLF